MDASRPGAAMASCARALQGNCFAATMRGGNRTLRLAQAQRLNVPLSELFGPHATDSVDVAWTPASGDTGRDIDEAEQMPGRMKRHRVFKLKIGARSALADDVAHVVAIGKALARAAKCASTGIQAWSESRRSGLRPASPTRA